MDGCLVTLPPDRRHRIHLMITNKGGIQTEPILCPVSHSLLRREASTKPGAQRLDLTL